MKFNPIPLITVFLLVSISSIAQQTDQAYLLHLRSGAFVPQRNITVDAIHTFNRLAPRAAGRSFAILQFERIPTESEKSLFSAQGIELLEYIPGYAYTVSISGALDPLFLASHNVRALVVPEPAQKMQTALAEGRFPSWAVKSPGTLDVWVSFPRTFSAAEVLTALRAAHIDIVSTVYQPYRVLAIRIADTRLRELASQPYVEYVEAAPHEDQPLNYNSMLGSRANVLRAPVSAGGRALNGEGVVVGVGDNGDIQSHIDFTGRLINRAGYITRAHAAHVAGTVGGAGLIYELYTGYAPKSTILSQLFSNLISYAPTYVQDHGMVIANHSYGSVVDDCYYNGLYDLSSRILDQQAYELPGLQHVFSAGNDGSRTCAPYAPGYKTVLGGYQSAKNVITVGSTDYKSDISGFSSRGPVRDGRLKPEIMAQGQSVASTWVNNIYSYNNGTSMAAPAVSGGIALLVQRYRALHGGSNPAGGLMKAILCNGGHDRGNPGPDFRYGFGRMDLLRSVEMLENGRYFNGSLTNGSYDEQVISVPSNTAQLKVLLYWHDPAASVMASRTLVNDLDLQVVTPGANTILPLILDTLPANVGNQAVTGADRMNNIEQVVIDNPAQGNYTLRALAHSITQNPAQEYFLVYDIIPESLLLTNPTGGEGLWPTVSTLDSSYIQWDDYGGTANDFTLEFSSDDGSSWTTLNNSIPAQQRIFGWAVPNTPTSAARIRISKNGTGFTHTSNPFTITDKPVDSLTPNQCEGYIQLGWRPVPGATDYEAMMLRGDEMQTIGTTTDLHYTFSGLSEDSLYWVTVRPRINGKPGRRAVAVSRQPNSGTCAGTISDNDLKLDSIISPSASGRIFTSTALTNSMPVTIRIKNLDDAVSSGNIEVSYSINGGPPVTETISSPASAIAAQGYYDHTFATPANLSAVQAYNIEVSAVKATDPVIPNNTLTRLIRQLDNQPITVTDLPWIDNLETLGEQTVTKPQAGLEGGDRYDFTRSHPWGRLRTFINTGLAWSGSRAINLDISRYVNGGNVDSLTATFNLASFHPASDDLRLDFRYKNHGQEAHPANSVWIRGSESDDWIRMYDLYANQHEPDGSYKLSESMELSDSLAAHGQLFSSSFQVRWGQWGEYMTADDQFGAGYSFDDIRIYTASDDIRMMSIDTPSAVNCGLGPAEQVRVTVRNTSNSAISDIPVVLKVDGVIVATETISSIPASSTLQYTFNPGSANLSAPGEHIIIAYVNLASDSYRENDTASLVIRNLPFVHSFPYLENFESGAGHWYTGGAGSSWEYGTPASPRIYRAASGTRAWKTGINGYYNNTELSYLYSPCFDLSGMTNPTLSFSLALDIEDCGASLCDAAWMEYSLDGGATWLRLGANGQGTNWYNKDYAGNQVWSQQDFTRWHVATTALPGSNNSNIRLRFVFSSDQGLVKDGIAVDDIHIYDNIYGIYDGATMGAPVTQTISGGSSWIDFTSGGKLVASVMPNNQAMGSTDVQAYIHTGAVRNHSGQYYHDRNIIIKPATNALADSAMVRFYFLDTEVEALLTATGCGSCSKPSSAYELGVSKYSDADDSKEDGDVVNSFGGQWSFINDAWAVKVPFDKGYYAEFRVRDFSEFWLNDGGITHSEPLPILLTHFTAAKAPNGRDVIASWETASEADVNRFEVELARGNEGFSQNQFVQIGQVPSQGSSSTPQSYAFTDVEPNKTGVRFYRLKVVNTDGSFSYSPVRPVVFTDEIQWQVFPNPSDGLYSLLFQADAGSPVHLRVFDAAGRLVHQVSIPATGFVQRQSIDLRSGVFSKGLYLVKAGTEASSHSFKLLKR